MINLCVYKRRYLVRKYYTVSHRSYSYINMIVKFVKSEKLTSFYCNEDYTFCCNKTLKDIMYSGGLVVRKIVCVFLKLPSTIIIVVSNSDHDYSKINEKVLKSQILIYYLKSKKKRKHIKRLSQLPHGVF